MIEATTDMRKPTDLSDPAKTDLTDLVIKSLATTGLMPATGWVREITTDTTREFIKNGADTTSLDITKEIGTTPEEEDEEEDTKVAIGGEGEVDTMIEDTKIEDTEEKDGRTEIDNTRRDIGTLQL